eukprot:5297203-Pyramimonas_sp.AAC.1
MLAQRGERTVDVMVALLTSMESIFEAALEEMDTVPENTHAFLDAIRAVIAVVANTPSPHHFSALQSAMQQFQDKKETIQAHAMLALYH